MGNDDFFAGLDEADDAPPPSEVKDTPAPEGAAPDASANPTDKQEEPKKAAGESANLHSAKDAPADKQAPVAAKPADTPAPAPAAERPAEHPDPRKWVPVGAHVELRNQFKALQEEVQRLKNPPPPPAPPPAPPEFTQDPKGYVDHGARELGQKVSAALEQLEKLKPVAQTAEEAKAAADETRFFTTLQIHEQQFAAANPDYYQALNHLREIRKAEIRLLDPNVTPEQLGQILDREELNLAANILRTGRNPSEVAYNLAKARGYAKPAPAPAPSPTPAPAPAAKLIPDVPEPKKLAPDLTLGTGSGAPVVEDDSGKDQFDVAWNEVFGGRKRA